MAVNINIDVSDPSGLLKNNQMQVAANRAAQQDKESQKNIEKKAVPLRQEALQSTQDTSGNRIRLESTSPTPKIREPAANRFDNGYQVMVVPFARNYTFSTGLGELQVWSQDGSKSVVDQINTGPTLELPDPIYEIQTDRPFPGNPPGKKYSGTGKSEWSSSWTYLASYSNGPGTYSELSRDGRVGYAKWHRTAGLGFPDERLEEYTHPDYETLMKAGASRTREEWVSTYSQVQVYDDYSICLPIAKDRCIFYYVIWGKRWSNYVGRKFSVTQTWKSMGTWEDSYVNPNQPSLIFTYTFDFFGLDYTRNLINQFDIEQKLDVFYEACFLVSNNAVKKINTPVAFANARKNLFIYADTPSPLPDPLKESDVAWTEVYEAYGARTVAVDDTNTGIDGDFNPFDPDDLVPGINFGVVPKPWQNDPAIPWPVYGSRTETEITPAFERYTANLYYEQIEDLNIRYRPTVQFEVLSHYGLGLFTTNYHGSNNFWFTPGIFAVLDNAETIRLDTNNTKYLNYQQLKAAYLTSKSTNIFIDVQNSSETIGNDFKFTKTMPINLDTPIPEEKFRKNLAALKIEKYIEDLPTGADYFLVWDWKEAAYCRKKVLDLGFTSQDLSF